MKTTELGWGEFFARLSERAYSKLPSWGKTVEAFCSYPQHGVPGFLHTALGHRRARAAWGMVCYGRPCPWSPPERIRPVERAGERTTGGRDDDLQNDRNHAAVSPPDEAGPPARVPARGQHDHRVRDARR